MLSTTYMNHAASISDPPRFVKSEDIAHELQQLREEENAEERKRKLVLYRSMRALLVEAHESAPLLGQLLEIFNYRSDFEPQSLHRWQSVIRVSPVLGVRDVNTAEG